MSALSFLRPLILLAPLAAGCPAPQTCSATFLGDPAGAPQIVPAALGTAGFSLLSAGDPIDLVQPIQGGHVVFLGAFARNVDACGGSLRGELRTDQGGQPGGTLVYDERSTNLSPVPAGQPTPPGAGWGQPQADPAFVSNIPACPDVLAQDIADATLWVQVTYTERGGRQVSGAQRVVPRCRQTDPAAQASCRCECQAGYTTDKCAALDLGLH